MRVEEVPSDYGHLKVWEKPLVGREYVIGIDVAEGKIRDRAAAKGAHLRGVGNRPDYSAAVVLREDNGDHVASWHGYIDTYEFATVMVALGHYYNEALLVPERNGPGLAVINRMSRDLVYDNIYRSAIVGTIDDDITGNLGWQTTNSSRYLLMQRIEEALLYHKGFTRDRELIGELMTMEKDDGGVPRAKHPNKDDRVLALGMALQGVYERRTGTLNTQEKDPLDDLDPHSRRVWQNVRSNRNRDDGSLAARLSLPGAEHEVAAEWREPGP